MKNFKTSRCNVQRSIIYNEKLALLERVFVEKRTINGGLNE